MPSRRGNDLEERSALSKKNWQLPGSTRSGRSHPRPAHPLRVSGGAQSGGGEGRGGCSLGAANEQRGPAVAPVTSAALPPPHGGRTLRADDRPSWRVLRGPRARSGGSARAQPLTRGRRGRGADTRMRAPRGGRGRRGRLLECRRPEGRAAGGRQVPRPCAAASSRVPAMSLVSRPAPAGCRSARTSPRDLGLVAWRAPAARRGP